MRARSREVPVVHGRFRHGNGSAISIVTIAQLERSYRSLKAENDRLNNDLRNLRREVDKHSGQLDVLTHFVQATLDRQADPKPERSPALPKD